MLLELSKGRSAQLDDADAGLLEGRSWWLNTGKHGHHYAVTRIDGKLTYLHRVIAGGVPGRVVDHINGDTLDNRRSNLRVCTQRMNCANRKSQPGPSGFRGVRKTGAGWGARIVQAGRYTHLGTYATAEEAARVRDAAAIAEYGAFAKLNFALEA